MVFLLGGGLITYYLLYAGREAEGPGELQAELPESAWAPVASAFRFDSERTKLVRDMSTDLFASHPDVQWWVFSYPGTVDAAYDHLFIPADAVATPPHEVSIADILDLHLLLWEDEIAEVRGSAWLNEAHSQSLAWQDRHQRLGSVSYTREQDVNAADDNVDPYVTWSLVVASPMVDLGELNLVEGTFLVGGKMEVQTVTI